MGTAIAADRQASVVVVAVPAQPGQAGLAAAYAKDTSDGVEYAVVSLHVSSRQNPNWVWGTFEHQNIPGRCDDIGCFDTFGATVPAVPPTGPRGTPSTGPA